jgi:tetratricopeptide (TPR) repeat protein
MNVNRRETEFPHYDFNVNLEIKNHDKKNEIIKLWGDAKKQSESDNHEKIHEFLEQISKLDDSLYGVWYNLGISKILADMSTGYGCFEKSIKLKLDHIDSWKGKKRYHALALNDPIVDDNLDFHINSECEDSCGAIIQEIEFIKKFDADDYFYFPDDTFLNLSLSLMKYSRFDQALKTLNFYGSTPIVDFFTGISLRKLSRYDESVKKFDAVLKEFPNNVDAIIQKGLSLYYKGDLEASKKLLLSIFDLEFKEADIFFKECIDQIEYFSGSSNGSGINFLKNNTFEDAIISFENDTRLFYNYNEREIVRETINHSMMYDLDENWSSK